MEFWGFFFFFFCCDKCLKEEMGMAKVGRGSLKSGVAEFCWSLEIVSVWVRFCLVLLVVEYRKCLDPILLGFCWSFMGFVLAVVGDGGEALLV